MCISDSSVYLGEWEVCWKRELVDLHDAVQIHVNILRDRPEPDVRRAKGNDEDCKDADSGCKQRRDVLITN